ncbi:Coenzyme F420 hydrogenase/dehydrogenase, beta subunit C-terminal domain [Phenylobacterium sp.]|uniref:Coenzyme F420 hydrogenase/dehydrogenase, beta subunit C-terminal domain n=1 Tax=Phenylobacterium sp. TaxID=1871053 RepID=UPI00374CC145
MIAETCPGAVVAAWPTVPNRHPVWGPYHSIYAGHAVDSDVRHKGSSGGAVTALAVHALDSGLVDRVVHVTANPKDPAGNLVCCSTNVADVIEGAGSRYVSSSPLADIERVLADGGSAAFIGKPCDVSALRRLALIDPRVDAHIPLMMAFFCAGIPSRRAVERVLAALDVAPEDLATFRYRGNGWPGKATATTCDGRVAQMTYEESWGRYLSKDVQFRCKICPDAVGGVADIACADAWYGGETGYPTFDELDGRSLIVSRTARGEQVLDAAVAGKAVLIEPLAITEIDLMQPSQAQRKYAVRARMAALSVTMQPRPRIQGLSVEAASQRAGLKDQARNFLGTIRRILLRRR